MMAYITVADPDISFGGHEAPRSSAKGARIEAPRGVRCGEGVSPSPLGVGSSSENFFNLLFKKRRVLVNSNV